MIFQIYTGSDTQFRVNGLDPKSEYSIRVGGVRVPVPGVEMSGTFSPPGIFTTPTSSLSPVSDPLSGGSKGITTTRPGFIPHVRTITIQVAKTIEIPSFVLF